MGKHCDRTVHVTACIATLFAVMASVSFIVISSMRTQTLLNLDEYNEIVHEWNTVPYVSVALVNAKDPCPNSHPALMFYDNWPGLDIMCYCEPSANYDSVYRVACQDERLETTKCSTREAIPTMYYGILHG